MSGTTGTLHYFDYFTSFTTHNIINVYSRILSTWINFQLGFHPVGIMLFFTYKTNKWIPIHVSINAFLINHHNIIFEI